MARAFKGKVKNEAAFVLEDSRESDRAVCAYFDGPCTGVNKYGRLFRVIPFDTGRNSTSA